MKNILKKIKILNKKEINDLGPQYHDYSFLGVENRQLEGIFKKNQLSKEYIIRAYIQLAIAKSKEFIDSEVSFAELFCADGYYTMMASKLGADTCIGIDNNKDGFFTKAVEISKRLQMKNVSFVNEDVNNINNLENVDIVANLGGLYHVENPKEILIKSYNMAKKFLIVQTVVSLKNNDSDYFESPAPGWTWGCRYSKESFHKMILDLKFDILDYHFNELEGNDRLEDKGSLYYIIKK